MNPIATRGLSAAFNDSSDAYGNPAAGLREEYKNRADSLIGEGNFLMRAGGAGSDLQQLGNWSEVRMPGKGPERRAYHSSFVHNKK
jgi:hypothetical protein